MIVGYGAGSGCDSGSTFSGGDPGTVMTGTDDMGTTGGCGLVTCEKAGATCGLIGDGCGNTIDCGTCTAPQTCGGGGTQFQCGGNNACVPMTAAQACGALNAECGEVSDGCGGTVTCGSCITGLTCGGGGVAFKCGAGGGGPCTPLTCAQLGSNCGSTGDGCGGTIDCGTCPSGQACGAGGVAGRCGSTTCTPRTCAQAGATCGFVGDGCGGIINYNGGTGPGCGTCTSPMICGGGGTANVCGTPNAMCMTTLCMNQKTCPVAGQTTTLTGTVTAPGHDDTAAWGTPDPIPGAFVFVPNATVQAFTPGVSCDQCGADVTGSPLVSATSGVDGKFTLSNVPCGIDVPVVIQLGRWRRQIVVPKVACCTNTALTNAQTHLPRNKTEGDIPKIAIVTGSADPMECILPKIGIDTSEFTDPNGTGRINFFQASTAGAGATISTNTPKDTALWGSLDTMKKYDLIIIDCEGAAYDKSAYYNNLISYTAAGGRIYTSHFGYAFLHGRNQSAPPALNTAWDKTATWNVNQGNPPNQTATIDQGFPKGITFAKWLNAVAGGTLGTVQVNTVRHDFDAVIAPSQRWVYGTDNGKANGKVIPLHYTFNTPVGAMPANQCGRVMFSDFHVNTGATGTGTFPGECKLGTGVKMAAQEKVLEFMLFDLTSCLKADIPMCTPKTCAQLGYNCGMQGDGCGGVINCGSCTSPQICGGSGVPGVCGSGCTPKTCAQQGYTCGPAGDGCGNLIASCGTCPAGQTCGGGGTGVCGTGACTPKTCAGLGLSCGSTGDGCGGTLNCGSCPAGQVCGGNGMPGKCSATSCTPRTCASANANCGVIGDGCGGTLDCGTCPSGQGCGILNTPNQCGSVG
ncbi:MAG: hypothetical protein U1A78_00725 [Polyangia bacterium]